MNEVSRVLKRLDRYLKECDGKDCVKKVILDKKQQADVLTKLTMRAHDRALEKIASNIRFVWKIELAYFSERKKKDIAFELDWCSSKCC